MIPLNQSSQTPEITEANWTSKFDPAIVHAVNNDRDPQAALHQKLFIGLLTATVEAWRRGSTPRRRTTAAIASCIPLAAAGAYALLWVIQGAMSQWLPAWTDRALYLAAGAVALVALCLRSSTKNTQIDLLAGPLWKRIRLGRLEFPFDQRRLGWTTGCLAALFGLQAGLINLSDGHAGLSAAHGFRESVLLTLDNLLHGILLDAGELYGLRLGHEIEHSSLSATVFLVFRVAFDVLVGLSIFLWYRGRELQKLVHDFPDGTPDAGAVCRWIEDVVRAQRTGSPAMVSNASFYKWSGPFFPIVMTMWRS